MRIPVATYRVQLHKDFGFRSAEALLPFLREIGISHLYVSPIFAARPGSTHGYDMIDPGRLNPELGSEVDFRSLVESLTSHGMGLLLDIVPNHMAATPDNPWWTDVLENGGVSRHSGFFDVEWGEDRPTVEEKIVLPVLGELYGAALESGKLRLQLQPEGLRVRYYNQQFPIAPGTYYRVLNAAVEGIKARLEENDPELQQYLLLVDVAERIPSRLVTDWEMVEARRHEAVEVKTTLAELYRHSAIVRDQIDRAIELFNGRVGDPSSFDALDDLLNAQPYQLTFWRAARERINYRRFFDVSELIGMRVQDPQVFAATHELALRLVEEGAVAGFRIDHIDGLFDPFGYLESLRQKTRKEIYTVVEKILGGSERLPDRWPCEGTTGYDFLSIANNLFVDGDGLETLKSHYRDFTGLTEDHAMVAYRQKKKIMEDLFAGEVRSLGLHLSMLAQKDRYARDLSYEELSLAIEEVTACMPIYRTYIRPDDVGGRARYYLNDALENAKRRNSEINPACFGFIRSVLTLETPDARAALEFTMRWQQLTGPIMAKGVEDTTMYLYNPLISMNEVGGSPVASTPERFHGFNGERQAHWPATMNATSTHDTKRSEDVRARINLLSEMAGDWGRWVRRWARWNAPNKLQVDGVTAPDANEEYFLYQTLLGAWPLEGDSPEFRERIRNYLRKAAREAKTHTSWLHPNENYENALFVFADAIVEPGPDNRFLHRFSQLQTRIAFYGALNALAQTLLKMTCPGVPDFYQRTTSWDFSLVDPDNRRIPDVASHWAQRDQLTAWLDGPVDVAELLDKWRDGRVKTFLIHRVLRFREKKQALFLEGDYLPLTATGLASRHAIAFARRHEGNWALIVAPRFTMQLSALERWPLGKRTWRDSLILLPPGAPEKWNNPLAGDRLVSFPVEGGTAISLAEILQHFPAGMLSGVVSNSA